MVRRSRLTAAERRASIVAAATEVFAELGYQRGTMAEVARRVGVSEPVVFQNFGAKSAVFAAVIEDATGRMAVAMREGAAAAGSIGAWLKEFLGAPHARTVGGGHHVLFADAMAQAAEPVVREAVGRAHRALARTLAELLRRGQADGSVRVELDVQAGAWWLLSLLASRGLRAATMPERARLEAHLATMTLQVLTTS